MKSIPQSYIEKVINNPEIQKLCKYEKGDWFWDGEKPVVFCKAGLGSFNPYEYKWLPTFTDLFKIWQESRKDIIGKHFYYFIVGLRVFMVKHTIGLGISDLIELTLYFVMDRKYNKQWNAKSKKWEEK
jgi:hypothetical protein